MNSESHINWFFVLRLAGLCLCVLSCEDGSESEDELNCNEFCFSCDEDTNGGSYDLMQECGCYEMWGKACLAADSSEECANVHWQLPNPNLCQGGADLLTGCGWVATVQTEVDEYGKCSFLDIQNTCMFISGSTEDGSSEALVCGEYLSQKNHKYITQGNAYALATMVDVNFVGFNGTCVWDSNGSLSTATDEAVCNCFCAEDYPFSIDL